MATHVPTHLMEALAKLADSIWREALDSGQDAGYQKGWDAATAALIEAAASKRTSPAPRASKAANVEPSPSPPAAAPSPVMTSRDYIVGALTAKPGMRPSEVMRWIQEKYSAVNDQTILTQIKRMRREVGVFEKRGDSKLFLVKLAKEAA